MGGKALKKNGSKRLSREEFALLSEELFTQLRVDFPGHRIEPLLSYRSKQSFGDIDILIESHEPLPDLVAYLEKTFLSAEVVANGDLVSFEYKGCQVDLMFFSNRKIDMAKDFLSFNDLGNLIRRSAHRLGLRIGPKGLMYKWMRGTQLIETIPVSQDWEQTLTLLGYDFSRWQQGFDSLEEIFEYVVSGKYFHPDMYLEEAHTRDARREVYQQFLEWLANRKHAGLSKGLARKSGENWLPYLFAHVEGFEAAHMKVAERLQMALQVKERFNGTLVAEWSGDSGVQLGKIIAAVKNSFSTEDEFNSWVLANTKEILREKVLAIRHQ